MDIYCIEAFKQEVEKLKKNNSYSNLQKEIIDYFFGKTIGELSNGRRLNGHAQDPYIKKRLEGSGGYRVYYLLVIVKENLYLIHTHPKTGKRGKDDISPEETKMFYKDVLAAIDSNDLYKVTHDTSKEKLIFNKVVKEVVNTHSKK